MSTLGRVVAALTAATVSARPATPQELRHEYQELHMGGAVRIVLYAADASTARQAARAAYTEIARLEDVMSDYRPESEVRRLATHPGIAVPVSRDLFVVLARALELSRRSDGAFDPTVGPLVRLWRLARKTGRLPPRNELDSAARHVGWDKVRLDSATHSARLDVPGMGLDLGAIAKGYILDRALDALHAHAIHRALLEAGGDIVVGDPPPGKTGWHIAVPAPAVRVRARAAALANRAISTSGDSEQFVVIDGVRYSHVIDPHSGMALTSRRAAIVIAPDGITADGLATTLTLLDAAHGAALLRAFPLVVGAVWTAH